MRAVAWLIPLLTLGLAACGGMTDEERFSLRTPGTDDPIVREIEGSENVRRGKVTGDEIKVIRGWADALRAGHVAAAAKYFKVPAIVADGTNPLRSLRDRAAVLKFNAGLECGAKLVETQRGADSFVIATFRLTERPGKGECGAGVRHLAATAFLIENRRIVQWRRAADPAQPANDDKS
jgi:hypothetical protein